MSDRRDSDLEEVWRNRGDRYGGFLKRNFTYHPVVSTIVAVVLLFSAVFVIGVVSDVIDFGNQAHQETKRVLSVKNIKEQRTALIQDWQDLLTAADNVCNVQGSRPGGCLQGQLLPDPRGLQPPAAQPVRGRSGRAPWLPPQRPGLLRDAYEERGLVQGLDQAPPEARLKHQILTLS
jgi:hypothetical protein